MHVNITVEKIVQYVPHVRKLSSFKLIHCVLSDVGLFVGLFELKMSENNEKMSVVIS